MKPGWASGQTNAHLSLFQVPMKKTSTIIAADSFRPAGVHRPVQPGEVLYVSQAAAKQLVSAGLAVPAMRAPEFAVRIPKESR
jgi:hypothetical protein